MKVTKYARVEYDCKTSVGTSNSKTFLPTIQLRSSYCTASQSLKYSLSFSTSPAKLDYLTSQY